MSTQEPILQGDCTLPAMTYDDVLARMRAICLPLPEVEESMAHGNPHFKVRGKIFAGCGPEDGVIRFGCKLAMDHAASLIASHSAVHKAKYVGHKGWITVDAAGIDDWDLVGAWVLESYHLIAPKTLSRQVGDG